MLDATAWPEWDPSLIGEEVFELVVQINGKTRGTVVVKHDIDEKTAKMVATREPAIAKWLVGIEVKRVIFVKNRLLNLIV